MSLQLTERVNKMIPIDLNEMVVLPSLLTLLFDSVDWVQVIMTILLIFGLWGMFKKSGIPSWYALIPCAREYMFARCAGREPEGRVTSVVTFLLTVLDLVVIWMDYDTFESLVLLFDILSLSLEIVRFIYMIRIYAGIINVYGRRRRWMVMWILLRSVTSIIWGWNKKYQPSVKVEDLSSESLTEMNGKEASVMREGLTVNLKERTATEFFQKKYLLRDIHMSIQPGHMVLLLGGSGAGKTTFLNAVNGYEKAKAKVTLNGGDVYGEYKKMMYQVGFVPQQELMRGKDTVYHTLMDSAVMRLPAMVSRADRKERVEEVMKIFGLGPVRGNLVDKLSGGQKKRLSIAMEFISNPSLFILDEPDSGLDGVMARELMEQLRKIADQGKIVIVITHTPDRVIDLFDDVIVLAKDTHRTGRLAFFGSIKDARQFFGKEKMEQIVLSINRQEEGGEGRADEFIQKYSEVTQHA